MLNTNNRLIWGLKKKKYLFINWIKERSVFLRKRLVKNFPQQVMIQTISSCNGLCNFCPYSKFKNSEQGIMSEGLYRKIIDECSRYNVSTIFLYLMNEPLLDKYFIKRAKYAKEKNPNAQIIVYSNGSILTKKKIEESIPFVDLFAINIYGVSKEYYESNMGLNFDRTLKNLEYLSGILGSYSKKLCVISLLREEDATISNIKKIKSFWKKKRINVQIRLATDRAQNIKEVCPKKKILSSGCWFDPFLKKIHILYNGKVILCCMDWGKEIILGDVKTKNIYDIWNSKKYQRIRNEIYSNKRGKEFLCIRCYDPYFNFYRTYKFSNLHK